MPVGEGGYKFCVAYEYGGAKDREKISGNLDSSVGNREK